MSLFDFFLLARGFLFPQKCALCTAVLFAPRDLRKGLCGDCSQAIAVEAGNKCCICGKPLISERETCLGCRNGEPRSYDRLWVLFPYTGKYRKLLKAYKFAKNISLANFFAGKIMELIEAEACLKDASVVPVPPRPGKIKHSLWDQVDVIARRLKKTGQVEIRRCLGRKEAKVQKSLNRAQRLENLKGRIYAKGTVPKTALIIDDVITTGSTMEACAAVLKENGTQKVYGLCLFYD